jgi:hypothetical protein
MKQQRKITKLMVGDKKWELGTNGVKTLEVQPPLAGVEYDSGEAVAIYAPNSDIFWWHKEQTMVAQGADDSDS